jgi:carboxypeptidase C (cathepsin A)
MMRHALLMTLICVLPAVAEEPKPAEAVRALTLNGQPLNYKVQAGTLPLKEEDGKVTANIFHVAYTKIDADAKKRPITFCFNGGPGSSSVWLHMGAFGPKRVAMTDEGLPLAPPGKLVENDQSILDLTDLVFIDPVSTGFSRAAPGTDAKKFHGFQGDLDSVGEFIRLYVTKYKRWDSPKFLAGESYGTTRASALVGQMQDKHGMEFNGVVLISAVLNFGTIRGDEGNDLPPLLFLPSFAAAAWYHGRVPSEKRGSLNEFLSEAEKFAEGDYAAALFKGDRLGEPERKQIVQRIATLTGVSESFVQRVNLRLDTGRFTKELLRDERRIIGRYDSRLKSIDADLAGVHPEFDPSYAAIQGAYTAGFNQYIRDLGFETDMPYEVLTGRVHPWSFGDANSNRYLNVAPMLRTAMDKNHALHLFLASGVYDLATPYFGTEYTLNHLNLDPEIRKNITSARYEAGHMMYIHRPSHQKLKKDLAGFYTAALPKN